MNISPVSKTAILTLISKAATAEKKPALFNDPMAVRCLERLTSLATGADRSWIDRERRIYSGMQFNHAKAGAHRARIFDEAANRYIAQNPGCTVINLGCGFDTRYWRIANQNCTFIDIDLPDVIALKKEAIGDQINYDTIGCSVLEGAWLDQVTAGGKSHFLLLAEGLFPFLPRPEAIALFRELACRFERSQLVFDTVPDSYTKGIWKLLLALESKFDWELEGVEWLFGLRRPDEVETFAAGLTVLGSVKGSAGPVVTVAINAG
jgi:O-methyltransferase involved in polyketide biosynthesis